jgi:hypothetical protein
MLDWKLDKPLMEVIISKPNHETILLEKLSDPDFALSDFSADDWIELP